MPTNNPASRNPVTRDLSLAFDVGYSSIGWTVLRSTESRLPEILGCGVVTFAADDCLASMRRGFRRQRRHIRATRRRIQRLEQFLAHMGVLAEEQLQAKHAQAGGHSAPWLLAARVLRGGKTLAWVELWDVLRWYAHNRGYDGNRRWSEADNEEAAEDTEKEENARRLMQDLGTGTMAETFCRFLEVDPDGKGKSASQKRFKGLNAAFPRSIVEKEVRSILEKHLGKLPQLDRAFISAVMDDGRVLPCPSCKLPNRFEGGLLFGQSVPRFDNRIISVCPVSGGKVCSKGAPEFLRYRWLMLLANIRVDRAEPELSREERATLHGQMQAAGALTPTELKAAVRGVTGCDKNNLDAMLMHPDAGKALVLDPVIKLIGSDRVQFLWPHLPERVQKRARGKWRRGKALTLRQLLGWCGELGMDAEKILQAATAAGGTAPRRPRRRVRGQAETDPLDALLKTERPSGRAPYARHILQQAGDEVLAGLDPRKKTKANDPAGGEDKSKDGVLVTTEAMMEAALQRPLDQLTNNHLVRHRLLILQRLVADIVADPALCGDAGRIRGVAIEVNSELKEMSGKTAQAIKQDLGLRLGNFKSVVRKLQDAGIAHPSPGLIRKARVAEDLGWTCPYTGKTFDPQDLLHPEKWDKDHIIPYADRPSNSLDSLVITTKEVNLSKKKRTALQFIEEMNRPENLAERDRLGVWTMQQYLDFVDGLYPTKKDIARFRASGRCLGHPDDFHRKRRRKQLLLLPEWKEKESGFLPRDLTVTSHLTRLGALVLRRSLPHLQPHEITSLPGSVTGTIRTGWKLLGCLSAANPGVLDENGGLRTKTEIRNITHLHHALDAIVIGLTHHYFPKSGRLWEAMVRREKQRGPEDNALLLATGLYHSTQHGVVFAKEPPLELTDQVRARLAERRVVQHVPADMGGVRAEQNTWRVVVVADGLVTLRQQMRGADGGRLDAKIVQEKPTKIMGLAEGKLSHIKGALVIEANYGVALDPEPQIIPWHKVWHRLRNLQRENENERPRILRNGMSITVPRGRYAGTWRVFSTKASLTLDLGATDKVALASTGPDQKREVQLRTLLRDGLEVLPRPLTGVAACASSRATSAT